MNYLAHIYLSGANEEILVGNFIGDYVKGFELSKYSDQIRKGAATNAIQIAEIAVKNNLY